MTTTADIPEELASVAKWCDLGQLANRLKHTSDFFRQRLAKMPQRRERIEALSGPIDDAVRLLELAAATVPESQRRAILRAGSFSTLCKVGRYFRARREALGLTQRKLAAASKVSTRTVMNIERDRHRPSLRVLQRIAAVLFADDSAAS